MRRNWEHLRTLSLGSARPIRWTPKSLVKGDESCNHNVVAPPRDPEICTSSVTAIAILSCRVRTAHQPLLFIFQFVSLNVML